MKKDNLNGKLEAIYPLSPMQQGMLFHSLYAPQSEVYVEQFTCQLSGALDIPAFQNSWQQIINHTAALRTLFMWEKLATPLQVVSKQLSLPWTIEDWCDLTPQDQAEGMAILLQNDRIRGFDLSRAPLMRLQLIRLSEQVYHFTWSFHHLLLDGWSLSTVLGQVFTCYEALHLRQSFSPPSARPYRDYINWLQKQDLSQAEQFWKERLAGFYAPTPLVGDYSQPADQADKSAYQEQLLSLSRESTERLQRFGREQQITLNTLIQGAWAILLSKYSGEQDVVFGVTVSGRPAELDGVEEMVGLFINTLPLRVQCSSQQPLQTWLQALQAQQSEARRYEYSPLVQVQSWSDIPAGQALFESLLVFENYPLEQSTVQELSLGIRQVELTERTNYPLTVIVAPGENLLIRLSYQPSRFSRSWINHLLEHFEVLLENMLAHPQQGINYLTLLTAAEQVQLLHTWNATQQSYPEPKAVHQQIAQQVQHTPDAIAVVFEEQALTYGELNRQANRLAHRLQRLQVGPDELVGVCLERSLELVIALLAVLKAGGAYVPLDPMYPVDRLNYLVEDAQISILLTQPWLQERLSILPTIHAIVLDGPGVPLLALDDEDPQDEVSGEQLAYMIYTSGSTGLPKGVKNQHDGLHNRVQWMQQAYQLTPADRVLQKTPYSFDVSVWEFFWPLLTGACLVVARPGGQQDPSYLVQVIREQQVTTLHFVPSMLHVFLQEPALEQCTSLRQVMCSGEALPFELQERFFARVQTAHLYNLYGPTEAAIDVTAWQCEAGVPVRIGRPIANIEMYVLDQWGEPVPVGGIGEIVIGGVGVARGYHRRAGLTGEKFVPDRLSGRVGARLFRTGDLGRYGEDGAIAYLGRRDQQVKLRGFRIELGEIEVVLQQQAGVKEALVIAREEEGHATQLVAYIIGQPASVGSDSDLRRGLKEKLPDYMVPAAFVWLDGWPLTPNGKLDRRALPGPNQTYSKRQEAFVAPRDTLEMQLVQIWENTLQVRPIGITDDFFALGGHSLLAIKLIAQIQLQLERKLPLSILFETKSIERLADILRQQNSPQWQSPIVPIQPHGSRRAFFCVHPGSGTALCFYDLALHLGLNQPFYGFQDPLIYEDEMRYFSIEDIATRYVQELRTMQPEGPYLLGGYSFGGIVAFEMAQQLQQQGQDVPLLIVLEGGTPISANKLPEDLDDTNLLAILALEILRSFTKRTLQELYDELQKRDRQEQLNYIAKEAKQAGFPDVGPFYIQRQLQLFKFRTQAMRSYGLKTYAGQLILFRSAEKDVLESSDMSELTTEDFGWRQLAAQPIEMRVISGHHDTIVREPYVQALAQSLELYLDKYN